MPQSAPGLRVAVFGAGGGIGAALVAALSARPDVAEGQRAATARWTSA